MTTPPTTPSGFPSHSGATRAMWLGVLFLLALLLAGNVAIFGVRFSSVVSNYRLFITEGAEGPHVYAIWRVLHHLPLYQWPDRPYFTLTFYNALFYHAYAAVLSLCRADGATLLLSARLITLAFGVVGSVCYVALLVSLVSREARSRTTYFVAGVLSLVVWFGTNFTSWWVLSIRPDVSAVTFALLGVWLSLTALRTRSTVLYVLASLAFLAAWGFKQSVVLSAAGVGCYLLLVKRDLRAVAALALPFGVVSVVALLVGGPEYRFNLLVAPTLSAYSLRQAAEVLARVLVQNAWVWLFPILVLVAGRQAQWAERNARAPAVLDEDRLLLTVLAVSLLAGALVLGRAGSNKNHLFEAYLVSGALGFRSLMRLRLTPPEAGSRAAVAATALLLIPMTAFPAVQLLAGNRYGVTRLASPREYAEKAALAQRMDAMPEPVFARDDILAQPWHSTGGSYPAVVLDNVWMDLAARRGLLRAGGVPGLIRAGFFRSAVVAQGSGDLSAALDAGFECDAARVFVVGVDSLVACRR